MKRTLIAVLTICPGALERRLRQLEQDGQGRGHRRRGRARSSAASSARSPATPLLGAIVGAAVGGAAGAFIGRYMDKQAEEMRRDLEGAKVERVGEGIKITFDSGTHLRRQQVRPPVREPGEPRPSWPPSSTSTPTRTSSIEGHTDSTGTRRASTSTLSENRAKAVLELPRGARRRSRPRFTTTGYGDPTSPSATTTRPTGASRTAASSSPSWRTTSSRRSRKSRSRARPERTAPRVLTDLSQEATVPSGDSPFRPKRRTPMKLAGLVLSLAAGIVLSSPWPPSPPRPPTRTGRPIRSSWRSSTGSRTRSSG